MPRSDNRPQRWHEFGDYQSEIGICDCYRTNLYRDEHHYECALHGHLPTYVSDPWDYYPNVRNNQRALRAALRNWANARNRDDRFQRLARILTRYELQGWAESNTYSQELLRALRNDPRAVSICGCGDRQSLRHRSYCLLANILPPVYIRGRGRPARWITDLRDYAVSQSRSGHDYYGVTSNAVFRLWQFFSVAPDSARNWAMAVPTPYSGNERRLFLQFLNGDRDPSPDLRWCDFCDGYSEHGDTECPLQPDYCGNCDGYVGHTDDNCTAYDSNTIRSYGYKPTPRFKGDGPRFLGFELELENESGDLYDAARLANSTLRDLAYLKYDGSLSDGFELVTHPMSYAWALENFPWQLLGELRDSGMAPTSSCGLHVHVSRTAFTGPAHVHRWLSLLYGAQDAVQHLARRRGSGWGSFGGPPTDPAIRAELLGKAKANLPSGVRSGRIGHYARYSAVNDQNAHTLEVRVFRSTLNVAKLQTALGLVDASVEFTKDMPFTTWNYFADFVESAKDKHGYGALHASMLTVPQNYVSRASVHYPAAV